MGTHRAQEVVSPAHNDTSACQVDSVFEELDSFRHTLAKSYLANGGDIFSLSRLLGHSEVKTTEIYLKDYRSADASAHHSEFSPVERFRLGRRNAAKKPLLGPYCEKLYEFSA